MDRADIAGGRAAVAEGGRGEATAFPAGPEAQLRAQPLRHITRDFDNGGLDHDLLGALVQCGNEAGRFFDLARSAADHDGVRLGGGLDRHFGRGAGRRQRGIPIDGLCDRVHDVRAPLKRI